MHKFKLALFAYLFLNCGLVLASDEYAIHFKGQPTDYQVTDFEMWTDDIDNYAFSAPNWLGTYANSTDLRRWYRVIPDVESISRGRPYCSVQIFTGPIESQSVEHVSRPCIEILGESKRDDEIPFGTRGLLLNYDGINQFVPFQKQEILPGKYPEISRTEIFLQLPHLTRYNYTLKDLRIMLNEIYARYGYRFKPGGEMDTYFSAQTWYTPKYDNVDVFLTDVEKSNAKLLRELLSPDLQAKKARFIADAKAFCEALKNNKTESIYQFISSSLTTGADQTVSFNEFKKILPEFKNIMLTRSGNCPQNMDRFIQKSMFDPEMSSPFLNATFIDGYSYSADEEEKKNLVVYFDFHQTCIPLESEIEVYGTLALKDYIDDTHNGKTIVRKIILKSNDMPDCITGADIDNYWSSAHVQLQLSEEDEKRFSELAGLNVTLRGNIMLGNLPQDYTAVKLINVTLESIATDQKYKIN